MGFEATFWQQYDPDWKPGEELPCAGILSGINEGAVFHAEPVHLKAGMSDLIMFAPDPALTADDQQALEKIINDHLAEQPMRFHHDEFGNGYLVLNKDLRFHTTPPSRVMGGGILEYLPQGADKLKLQRLSNELQMLLHGAPFNQEREQRGALPVNALWLWGNGTSQRALQARHDLLISNHPWARACANHIGQTILPRPEPFDLDRLPDPAQRILITSEGLQGAAQVDDIHTWRQALDTLEQQWLKPLQTALQNGQITRLTLLPCNGRAYTLSPRSHWKKWRRNKPLALHA